MAGRAGVSYLDTKAVVIFSISYILKKHGFPWIGDRPRIPTSFSSQFYHVLRHILDIFDREFMRFYEDLTPSVIADPAKAIEDAGHMILRKDTQNSNFEVTEFLQVSQTNIIALIYFSAVVAIKVQEDQIFQHRFPGVPQSTNGYRKMNEAESAKINGSYSLDENGFKKHNCYERNCSLDLGSPSSSVLSTPLSDDADATLNLADSNEGSSLKSSGYGSVIDSLSCSLDGRHSKYPYSSTTMYVANKTCSFINKHVGHHISAKGGWVCTVL